MPDPEEEAKTKAEEGKGAAEVTEGKQAPAVVEEPEGPKGAKPETEEGKGKSKPEDWEQKYKTLQGIHERTVEDFTALKAEKTDYQGVVNSIEQMRGSINQHGETLTLLTDIMSETAVDNEAMQTRITKARESQATQKAYHDKVTKIYTEIVDQADIAGLNPQSEELKTAREAWDKGQPDEALRLTKIAVKTAVSAMRVAKPEETTEPDPAKAQKDKDGKIPIITATPGAAQDWRELKPGDKMKLGLQEARENQ